MRCSAGPTTRNFAEPVPSAGEFSGNLKFVKLNVLNERNNQLAAKFGVMGTPTVILFSIFWEKGSIEEQSSSNDYRKVIS